MFDERIDITREVCPMTYVRVKLRLEVLQPGQTLEVLLRGDEPLRNVPRSASAEGHEVLSVEQLEGGTARLVLRRGATGVQGRHEGAPRPVTSTSPAASSERGTGAAER